MKNSSLKPGDKFTCACGREQTYQPSHKRGGITWAEAQEIGWRGTPVAPVCPFCVDRKERQEQINARLTPKAKHLLEQVKALPLQDRASFAEAYDELESEWCPYCYADMPEGSEKHPCFDGAEERVSNIIRGVTGSLKAKH